MRIGAFTNPYRGTRGMDKWGSGVFMADRDGGTRPHLGRDFIALPDDEGISPIRGVVERVGLAYPDDIYGSIHIRGLHEHTGLLVKILYVRPDISVGWELRMRDQLGVVQDITRRYPGITPHIHGEVYVAHDPESLIEADANFGGPVRTQP